VTQHPWHREALMLMLVVPLFLFVPLGVGLWFDTRTSAAPWGLLIGMGTGAAAATFFLVHRLGSVYRAIAPDTEDNQEKK
jgi:F0F1-type ATP synthase assembly protein I